MLARAGVVLLLLLFLFLFFALLPLAFRVDELRNELFHLFRRFNFPADFFPDILLVAPYFREDLLSFLCFVLKAPLFSPLFGNQVSLLRELPFEKIGEPWPLGLTLISPEQLFILGVFNPNGFERDVGGEGFTWIGPARARFSNRPARGCRC